MVRIITDECQAHHFNRYADGVRRKTRGSDHSPICGSCTVSHVLSAIVKEPELQTPLGEESSLTIFNLFKRSFTALRQVACESRTGN